MQYLLSIKVGYLASDPIGWLFSLSGILSKLFERHVDYLNANLNSSHSSCQCGFTVGSSYHYYSGYP